jgi:hypothetical protein
MSLPELEREEALKRSASSSPSYQVKEKHDKAHVVPKMLSRSGSEPSLRLTDKGRDAENAPRSRLSA